MKVLLRMEGTIPPEKDIEIEVHNHDIIVCQLPQDFTSNHIQKLKEMFVRAFKEPGPNIIFMPKAVELKLIRCEEKEDGKVLNNRRRGKIPGSVTKYSSKVCG